MYKILTFLFASAIFQLSAQNQCCTATKQFADLGSSETFQKEHQLPASGKVENAAGSWIEFNTPDQQAGRAYLVKSKVNSNKYLFLFHEWWGLNDNIIREAEEWAIELKGVNIMAIDLYDGKVATTREEASEFMQAASENRIRSLIEGASTFAGQKAQIATMGWCFGGGWSMQAAIQLEDQAVGCILYYGMPERDSTRLLNLDCKVLGIFAEKDKWINRKVVGEYEQAMNTAKKAYETYWYDAEHAFANPSNPIFDEKSASEANEISRQYLHSVFD